MKKSPHDLFDFNTLLVEQLESHNLLTGKWKEFADALVSGPNPFIGSSSIKDMSGES